MDKSLSEPRSIDLSFAMESSSSLWNLIFEGFDQEVVLVSRFVGNDPDAIGRLYRFGDILSKRYKDCSVEVKESGIEIKKLLPENDLSVVHQWIELMRSMRREMSEISPK